MRHADSRMQVRKDASARVLLSPDLNRVQAPCIRLTGADFPFAALVCANKRVPSPGEADGLNMEGYPA